MNSSAALKAFVGRNGGAVCTSSNARAGARDGRSRASGDKVLFFPDQHLGRNTGFTMGYTEADMRVWNPRHELGGLEERDVKDATFLLWKGHCSVHQRFRPAARRGGPRRASRHRGHRASRVRARRGRAGRPGRLDRAHPGVGRRRRRAGCGARRSAPRSTWCSAWPPSTPTRRSSRSTRSICPCSTMFRIDGPHLAWVLENLVAGDGREPDRRRRRHRRVGAGRARAHARRSPEPAFRTFA